MFKKMIIVAVLAVLIIALILPADAAVMVGDVAPEISLIDHLGNNFSLTANRGKTVILFFLGYS